MWLALSQSGEKENQKKKNIPGKGCNIASFRCICDHTREIIGTSLYITIVLFFVWLLFFVFF
jgi:hypothetical protein